MTRKEKIAIFVQGFMEALTVSPIDREHVLQSAVVRANELFPKELRTFTVDGITLRFNPGINSIEHWHEGDSRWIVSTLWDERRLHIARELEKLRNDPFKED